MLARHLKMVYIFVRKLRRLREIYVMKILMNVLR